MTDTTAAASCTSRAVPKAARALFSLLRGLNGGTLDLQLPDTGHIRFGTGAAPFAAMRVHDWRLFGAVLRSGDVGLAEGFMDEAWSTPDLPTLMALLLANRGALRAAAYGRWCSVLLHRAGRLLHRNSRRGSRRNVQIHYDLGNAFYRSWLDETMSYSSAWFDGDAGRELRQAQHAKMQRALAHSAIRPGQRLLEIGCGWGALAGCAAVEFGAHVTGVTLSREQLAFGLDQVRRAGLQASIRLRLQDYRDIDDGPYDALVSIEMFEAVGRAYWPLFFTTVRKLLKHGARACIQSIVIREDLFERYARSTDFIRQYIFPGGFLPSPRAFRAQAARAGLCIIDECAFGADYARTLRHWRARFLAQEGVMRRLGFDTRFVRTWEFYLAYCEAAFDSGDTDVVQFTLERR
jgi:cyclopropane-fatty-acyl-phospholipid synthase